MKRFKKIEDNNCEHRSQMDAISFKKKFPPLREPKPERLHTLSAKDPQHINFPYSLNRGDAGASERISRDEDVKYDFDQLEEGDPQSDPDLCSTRTKWAIVTSVTIILALVFVNIKNKGLFK